METVVLIIALWLILVGIYGALSLLGGAAGSRPRAQRKVRVRQQAPSAARVEAYGAPYDMDRDASGAILSEVDLLRAQVRHLRSEIFAISGRSDQPEETKVGKPKRYRGQTDLPRPLRRHLRETRGVRA